MKTDVKTLIAALTTERNAIDRAIAGLKQMSEVRDADAHVAASPRGRPKARKRLTPEQWSEVRNRLDLGQSVKDVAARFGIHQMTVYKWRSRGLAAVAVEQQPASNATAIGVQ